MPVRTALGRVVGGSRGRRILGVAAGLLLGVLGGVASLHAGELDNELQDLIDGSRLDGELTLSVTIIDAETGETLGEHKASKPMIPASNMKVLTSGTAMSVLGPDFTFETDFILQKSPGGTRLVIRGAGDPAFADPDLLAIMNMGVEDFLNLLTQKIVAAAGGTRITEVVADDRVFDRELVHPTWPDGQLNRRYCAEVSGLNFQRNVIAIYAEPGPVGRPPTVTLEPVSPWIEVDNHARSVDRSKQHTAWASRKRDTNDIGLHGDVRSSDVPVEVTIHDPALQFARLMADRLGKAGAGAGGGAPAARTADTEEDLSGGQKVYSVRTPITTVIERCNVDSQNLYAESLLKRVGHEVSGTPGSWANGAAVVRMELIDRLGAWAGSEVIVADGSGMSRENRVTTRAIARWLKSVGDDERIGDAFIATMAEAAEEGTLKKRFRGVQPDHEVRAKTGYLSGVSALSGFVLTPGDGAGGGAAGEHRVVFSIISNDKPNSVALSRVRQLEEKIVLMIDDWVTSKDQRVEFGG